MYLNKKNCTLYYEDTEEGYPIILLNGYTRPCTDFRAFTKHLTAFGHRVVLMDHRGSGLTKTNGPFTLDDMASDIVDLLEHLDIRKTNILGVSMGGFIAQQLTINFPNFFKKMLLVSTSASEAHIHRQKFSSSMNENIEAIKKYFHVDFYEKNKLLIKALAKQVTASAGSGDADDQQAAIKGFDVSGKIDQLALPTLIIHGKEDQIIPYSCAEEFKEKIPESRLQPIDTCGHLILAEKPKELYKFTSDFLSI